MRASWIFAGSVLSLSLAALGLGACSGTTTSTTLDDGGVDGSQPVTDGGKPTDADIDSGIVPTSEITKVVADTAGGGFSPTPPDGSACAYGLEHYEYEAATKKMTFKRCAAGATVTDPLVLDTGERDLTDAQVTTLNDAIAAMKVTKETSGGADKPVLTVSLTTAKGTTLYYDSFYSNLNDGKIYVDNMDGVFQAFEGFAPTK